MPRKFFVQLKNFFALHHSLRGGRWLCYCDKCFGFDADYKHGPKPVSGRTYSRHKKENTYSNCPVSKGITPLDMLEKATLGKLFILIVIF